jgi:hypothetical protein
MEVGRFALDGQLQKLINGMDLRWSSHSDLFRRQAAWA